MISVQTLLETQLFNRHWETTVATTRIKLVQDPLSWATILFSPVVSADVTSQYFNQYLGLVLGVFRIGQLINAAMADQKNLNIYVLDVSDNNNFLGTTADSTLTDQQNLNNMNSAAISVTKTAVLADHVWSVVFTPKQSFLTANSEPYKIIALVLSIILGGLLCLFVFALVKRAQYMAKVNNLLKDKAKLLEKILPPSIVERIQKGEKLIADEINDVSILFMVSLCNSVS
jgi:CHASE1-domain containing sensor protein